MSDHFRQFEMLDSAHSCKFEPHPDGCCLSVLWGLIIHGLALTQHEQLIVDLNGAALFEKASLVGSLLISCLLLWSRCVFNAKQPSLIWLLGDIQSNNAVRESATDGTREKYLL